MPKTGNKPVIAIDFDEVLSEQNQAVRRFINKNYGHSHKHEDYLVEGDYWGYWEDIWGVDHEEGEKRLRHFWDSELAKQKPLQGAVKAVKTLKLNYKLIVVTSRNEEFMEVTHEWLDKHLRGVFDHVKFTSTRGLKASGVKAGVLKDIGASYLIDDNLEHCTAAARENIKALLFGNYGWTKGRKVPGEITRVKNWEEVLVYFNGQG